MIGFSKIIILNKYMNIIVTGGLGFIGSTLIRSLLKNKKFNIFNIDKISKVSELSQQNSLKTEHPLQ